MRRFAPLAERNGLDAPPSGGATASLRPALAIRSGRRSGSNAARTAFRFELVGLRAFARGGMRF